MNNVKARDIEDDYWSVYDVQVNGKIDTTDSGKSLHLIFYEVEFTYSNTDFDFYQENDKDVFIKGFSNMAENQEMIPVFLQIEVFDDSYHYEIYCLIQDYTRIILFNFYNSVLLCDNIYYYGGDFDIENEFRDKYMSFNGLRNQYIDYNLPCVVADNGNEIEVLRDYDDYTDAEGLMNYRIDKSNYMTSDHRYFDDKIIEFVPREYFFKVCEEAYYGEGYGFYIKTVNIETGRYRSYLSTFLMDFSNIASNNEDGNVENQSKIIFTPLFTIGYTSTLKNETLTNYYSYVNDSTIVPDYFELKFGYSGFGMNYSTKNFLTKNKTDEDYSITEDNGVCITGINSKILNEEVDEKESSNFINSAMYLIGLIGRPLSIISDIYSVVGICEEIMETDKKDSALTTDDCNDYFFDHLRDSSVQVRTEYVKEVSFSLGEFEKNRNSYGMGVNNYHSVAYNNGLRSSYRIKINFGNCGEDNYDMQETRCVFITCLQSYDRPYDFDPVILIFDYTNYNSYINYSDNVSNYYSNIVNLSQHNPKLYSIKCLISDFYTMNVNSDSIVYIKIIDSNGRSIFYKSYLQNIENQTYFYMMSDLIYYIIIEYKMSGNCNMSFSISSSTYETFGESRNLYVRSYIEGHQGELFKIYIPSLCYISTYTSGNADTKMYIYKNDKELYHNDDGFLDDEENYNSLIEGTLNEGWYYVLIENLSYSGEFVAFNFTII